MLIPLAFVAFGGTMLVWSMRELGRALDSTSWPVVRGTIVSSLVKSEFDSTADLPKLPLHSASIRYRYEVGGKHYESQRIKFGPTIASSVKSQAQADHAHYPLDKVVDIRVSPAQPALSVLLPGADWELYGACAVAAVFSAIGLGLLVHGLR